MLVIHDPGQNFNNIFYDDALGSSHFALTISGVNPFVLSTAVVHSNAKAVGESITVPVFSLLHPACFCRLVRQLCFSIKLAPIDELFADRDIWKKNQLKTSFFVVLLQNTLIQSSVRYSTFLLASLILFTQKLSKYLHSIVTVFVPAYFHHVIVLYFADIRYYCIRLRYQKTIAQNTQR